MNTPKHRADPLDFDGAPHSREETTAGWVPNLITDHRTAWEQHQELHS